MTYFTTGAQLQAALNALPNTKTGNFVAFDSFFYGQQYMADYQGTLSPIEHFVQIGAARGYKPNATFDPTYYKNAFADLKNTDFNAADLLYHFMQYGLDEGRIPSEALATFDGTAYLAANPDVAAYVNANLAQFGDSVTNGALAHYVKFGAAEGRTAPGTSVSNGQTFTLTANTTDVGTGNAFSAPDIFNGPSGTYLQSLNTGDKLTGTGTNPTLNATLTGTAATPTMTGVETLNLTATAATNLTLSASTGVKNINSVDSVAAPTVLGVAAALTSAGLTRTDSNLAITHANAALAGASDAITLNLNTAGSAAAQPTVTLQTATAASGYETVNIVTAGGASRLAALTDGNSNSLATINVAGNQALRIDGALDATVKTLDASAMTEGGSVRATLQAFAAGHAVTGSLGNDRITIQDLNANDVVGLAAGTGDTLIAVDTSNNNTINGLSTNITGVETLGVVSGTGGANTVTFDSTKVAGITGVTLTNGDTGGGVADNFAATINNEVLTSKSGNGVTLTTPAAAGNAFGTVGITVKGADTSGSDHLTINIGSDTATNTTAFNTGVITANSIETLTLNVGDGAAHTVGGVTAGALGTLNITGGTANTNFTLTGGTAVANINASAFKGDLVLTGVAAAGATATQYVEMGAGRDDFTFSLGTPGTAVAAANPINIVTGGAGADTFEFAPNTSNTFSTAGFLLANVTSGSLFDRIVDLQLGGISTNASTGSDFIEIQHAAGALARGSSTIVNDGQVVALSTTTYTTLHAALAAVVGGASVS